MKTLDPPELAPGTNDSEQLVGGIFDPPESFALTAIGRHKRLLVAFAILGALAGALLGLARPVTYEAAATLQVGQVNPNSPGFASFTQSSSSLATAFSRAIAAQPVLAKVNRKLEIPESSAAARLSSEPIALSPAFRVIATGPSAADAMRLANVSATAVAAYVNKTNSANPEAKSLLSEYQQASLALSKASDEVSKQSGEGSDARLRAKAAQSAAKIRLKAIANAYIATVGSQPPREGFVTVLATATGATSNRGSEIQLLGFIGLLGGLLLGGCAALLVERRGERAAAEPAFIPPPR